MIDLHTHTLLSDGDLLPSELVRRAVAKGYEAIALTDHVDSSNIDFIIPRLVKVCDILNSYWPIKVIPGIEITHVPIEILSKLVQYGRDNGAKIIVVHGATVTEPVLPGTNLEAIKAKCDLLAHPGFLTKEEALLAKKNDVFIEITTRHNHLTTNQYIRDLSREFGLRLILNTDTHQPEDIIDDVTARNFLKSLNFTQKEIESIFFNSKEIVKKIFEGI